MQERSYEPATRGGRRAGGGASTIVLAVSVAVSEFPRGLIPLACVMVAGAAAWYGALRRGIVRVVGLGVAAVVVVSKYAQQIEGGYRIKLQPPVIVRPPEAMSGDFEQVIRQGLAEYARSLGPDRRVVLDRYHYTDFARRSSASARSAPRR